MAIKFSLLKTPTLLLSYLLAFFFFSVLSFSQSSNNKSRKNLQHIESNILILKSDKLFQRRKNEAGKKTLRKAMKMDPLYYRPNLKLGSYYFSEGLYKLASNEFYIARDKYINEYELKLFDSRLEEILFFLGESELQRDHYKKALEAFELVKKYNPKDTESLERGAWVYYKIEDYDKSREYVDKCLKINPYGGGCLNVSGILYSKQRKYKKALKEYNKAYGLNPDVKNNNMGEVHKSLFEYKKAKEYYKKVVESDNSLSFALTYLNLCDIYISGLKLNEAQRTLNQYEKSMLDGANRFEASLLTDMGFIFLYLSRVKYYGGDLNEALSLLDKAIDYPQHFGSIGYNQYHYKHLIYFMRSLVYESLAYYEDEKLDLGIFEKIESCKSKMEYKLKAWWNMRKAAEIAVSKLNRLEDLYINETEAIFDYANISELLTYLDTDLIMKRLEQLSGGSSSSNNADKRKHAKGYYDLYKGHILYQDGSYEKAKQYLMSSLSHFNEDENAMKLKAYSILANLSNELDNEARKNLSLNHIYALHKPYLRLIGKNLPVEVSDIEGANKEQVTELRGELIDLLSKKRFHIYDRLRSKEKQINDLNIFYQIRIKLILKDNLSIVRLVLAEKTYNKIIASSEVNMNIHDLEKKKMVRLINDFSKKAFRY